MSAPTLERQIEHQSEVVNDYEALRDRFPSDDDFEKLEAAILASLRELAEWRRLSEEYRRASRELMSCEGDLKRSLELDHAFTEARIALLEHKP